MTVTILGEGAATITGLPPTIAAVKRSPAHTAVIANHETSEPTMKAQRKNGARIVVANIAKSPVTTSDFSDLGKNKRYLGNHGALGYRKR